MDAGGILLNLVDSITKQIEEKFTISSKKPKQSQGHGFVFENEIRTKVFDLPVEGNSTTVHDIPCSKNKFDENENCSIKTTGSQTICCGDVLRFYNYDFNKKNTIIVINYDQLNDSKKAIKRIYEIDYNKECHKKLFGNLPKDEIKNYVDGVKSIPAKVKGAAALQIYDYKSEKNRLSKKYNNTLQLNPKVDSKQSRVQCSITNFEQTLKDFITYVSPKDTPSLLRGTLLIASVISCRRRRHQKNSKS